MTRSTLPRRVVAAAVIAAGLTVLGGGTALAAMPGQGDGTTCPYAGCDPEWPSHGGLPPRAF